MYIIELINKLRNKKKSQLEEAEVFEEETPASDEVEDALACKHNFMPIDSTKTVLACTKCGYVIKNTKMKVDEIDKNPFKEF